MPTVREAYRGHLAINDWAKAASGENGHDRVETHRARRRRQGQSESQEMTRVLPDTATDRLLDKLPHTSAAATCLRVVRTGARCFGRGGWRFHPVCCRIAGTVNRDRAHDRLVLFLVTVDVEATRGLGLRHVALPFWPGHTAHRGLRTVDGCGLAMIPGRTGAACQRSKRR
jgi:hypothetical protein